jgi:hypothetical protein
MVLSWPSTVGRYMPQDDYYFFFSYASENYKKAGKYGGGNSWKKLLHIIESGLLDQ